MGNEIQQAKDKVLEAAKLVVAGWDNEDVFTKEYYADLQKAVHNLYDLEHP